MKSFLHLVVQDILKQDIAISECIFVLPSQRATVFLKNELKQQVNKATFLPQIVTIEQLVSQISGLQNMDTTQLLFEFYNIYKANTKNPDNFDVFSSWARTLLTDFNDVDAYLLETNSFFNTLKATSRMNTWFQDEETPTQLSKNYLAFFENIHTYYDKLTSYLKQQGLAYQGLLYKEAVNKLKDFISTNTNKTVFVGFNALNKAEQHIIHTLLQQDHALAYWDNALDVYGSNPFLKDYKDNWSYYQSNDFKWFETETTNQNITFVGAPKNVIQFKHVASLLENQEAMQNTALVLANESLLPLALNSLPRNIEKVNVTMGFPLVETPIKSFFDSVFTLTLNQQKFGKQDENLFYYKDVINLLNHSFTQYLFEDKTTVFKIISSIQKQNIFFVNASSVLNFTSETSEETIQLLLETTTTIQGFLNKLFKLIARLKDQLVGIEKEMLFHFNNVFLQLDNLHQAYPHFQDISQLNLFFRQLTQQESLSFHGEPLHGLQLMGMLETRVLDFETVILTSANEGILPVGKTANSFIPFDVKKHYGLPTYHDKDAIFSYHFFRLIKRAKNVFILYNTETDEFGQGEKSRFLTQLEIQNPKIKQQLLSANVAHHDIALQTIEKTPEALEKLKLYAEKGISPSALGSYVYNPVQFYMQKVLGVNELDEVEETIANNTFGSVVHDVLDELYTAFKGKYLMVDDFDQMREKVDALTIKYFTKHYQSGSISEGKNKLIVEVAKNFVNRFLQTEQDLVEQGAELKIIATELRLETPIKVPNLDFPIKLRGTVDRVDQLDGVTRIIDYKTGKVEHKNLKMDDMSLIHDDYQYSKAMQVLLYSYMYTKEVDFDFSQPLESGIFSFKNFKAGVLSATFDKKDKQVTKERLDEFMQHIYVLIQEIFDLNVPFQEKEV